MHTFESNELHLSQIPALQLLANVGYEILTPDQVLEERQGKLSNVLLEHVLYRQLQKLNRIQHQGGEYPFSEANIQEAIQKIKNVKYDGLLKTNEAIYDLITLGAALEQRVEGNSKSFTLNYIDWKTPGNNAFHVAPEFAVERNRTLETARPDIVLFVNGIPLAVIECKSPGVEVEQAVSQNIRNQGDEYIPKLFTYVQLVMGVNKNAARYATAGTPAKFWSVWKEIDNGQSTVDNDGGLKTDSRWYKNLSDIKNTALSETNIQAIEQTFRRQLPSPHDQPTVDNDGGLKTASRWYKDLSDIKNGALSETNIQAIEQTFRRQLSSPHDQSTVDNDGGLKTDSRWYKGLSDIKNGALSETNIQAIEQTFRHQLPTVHYQLTVQDTALYSLCRPERLLELTYRFTLFDAGIKKIARYQQFFAVRSTLARIRRRDRKGVRAGGVIWHTQGSGKSLTMVMLARALLMDNGQWETDDDDTLSTIHSPLSIKNPRIILVTDRDNLDKQLGNTFAACGLSKERATSGRNLVKHLKDKAGVITTLIHKFDKGWASGKYVDESTDIFVLVDESHRTNFGELAARMRQILPNACYLGFTGTPLLKEDKNNFLRFGGLVEPHYSIRQAVKDRAVLPLLYEGRHVEMMQNKAAIDLWFERHTSGLNKRQRADLKKKYARAEMLNKAEQVIYMRAFDISEHYRANWQGAGFKAQLVAPDKAAALTYHESLKDIGFVTSEVIISPSDTREGHEEVDEGPTERVGRFWDKMMRRFGSEEEYAKQIIDRFKHGEEPEILIVVDKLLTGFDAPVNTVLYLCRTLREHTLLQTVARVNRLHEGKDFGYIVDYASVLGELDKALTMYDAFEGFDEEDLLGTLTSINEEVQRLPQRHSDLWDVFEGVTNKHDEEAFEALLADDERRKNFYDRLAEYSKTLGIALSADRFIMETDESGLRTYKNDLRHFQNLKKSVKLRYAEAIDYRDYEPKIKKLLDTHIQASEVTQFNEPVDIFDDESFDAVKRGQGVHSCRGAAARADIIAHATKKAIHEKMEEDPAFYEKFSRLIQQAIDDFKAHRISDMEYLNTVSSIRRRVVSKHREDVPGGIRDNDEACAYFGMARDYFHNNHLQIKEETIAYMAESFQQAFAKEKVIDFWHKQNAINKVKGRMDDFFYDELKDKQGVELKPEQMDEIIEKTMRIAKSRADNG